MFSTRLARSSMISTTENKDAWLILQNALATSKQQSCVGLPRNNSPSAAREEAKTHVCSLKTAILIQKKGESGVVKKNLV